MLLSNQPISHSQENYSLVAAKMFSPPDSIKPILHDMSVSRTYLSTCSSWIFVLAVLNVTWTSRSNPSAYRLTTQKQHFVISVRIVLSCPAILSTALPPTVLLSAETLGTSCFTKKPCCLSETGLNNRVHKWPFIRGKPDQTEAPNLPSVHPFPYLKSTRRLGIFSGQGRLGTRVNMCRRGWRWDQGVNHTESGLSVRNTSWRSRNNGVSVKTREINEHIGV